MSDRLGMPSAVSIALGGMIGGGIFSVLGVVARIAGTRTWLAFVVAGVVALCAGYSYNRLNAVSDRTGASVTFVQRYTNNTTIAGMVGWTLLFGYIGSMAMYAYAFGEYSVGLLGLRETLGGLARPLVSALAVVGFVALNRMGARATGTAENVLVAAKMAVLLGFGVLAAVYGHANGLLDFGITGAATVAPVVAAGVSFVAFQGWQLLFYDRESIADPETTIPRAVYVAVPVAVATYVLVGVTTTSLLTPAQIAQYGEIALAKAAQPVLGSLGFTIIAVAAVVSTGSAINATLFSAAHFADGMTDENVLPDRIASSDGDGVPQRTVLLLGIVTLGLTVYGTLDGITALASFAFLVVFGTMSALAFAERDRDRVHPLPPLLGAVGAACLFPLLCYHLAVHEPQTFGFVVLTLAAVFVVELTYFERTRLARVAKRAEDRL
ncbi:APC family permease [Halarchaeum nitratireducens]|uniref:Amino acid transporter n=1 Tax=Halarchaeum nitratireducens TaxID=489913 RepID=A0A830GAE6_9EURY|nr:MULTISPECIES: APC family permease [Halarchaeum]MBP2251566.1 amino acid transporter [Halarchaeum solikamskense]GGN14017.1 amino acid transporter [Halarchaeum nitratireducens]